MLQSSIGLVGNVISHIGKPSAKYSCLSGVGATLDWLVTGFPAQTPSPFSSFHHGGSRVLTPMPPFSPSTRSQFISLPDGEGRRVEGKRAGLEPDKNLLCPFLQFCNIRPII